MTSSNDNPTDTDMFEDAIFGQIHFDDYTNSLDSPFDSNQYFDATADSPAPYQPRTPAKSLLDIDQSISFRSPHQQNPRSVISSRSGESSSQDSASEASVSRNRKTTSESPPADTLASLKVDNNSGLAPGERMDTDNQNDMQAFDALAMDQDMLNASMDISGFDFDSAASSPGGMDVKPGAYATRNMLVHNNYHAGPPAGTIEPAQFFIASTGGSPSSAQNTGNAGASPAMYPATTVAPSSTDLFSNNGLWDLSQQPNWQNGFSNGFTSPGTLGLTPSPVTKHKAITATRSASTTTAGLVPLHIGAIPAKSRVETQINIRMTIDQLPPGIQNLHLPTHTIAKAKLLNKDIPAPEETLELHAMLVCTSAMNEPENRERALKNAALQSNGEIQSRGIAGGMKEEDRPEEDKPANGGEVRICQNCINRERKRAARKKLKKEEEQAHWEKYETERVIVFNTNEYKAWLEWQPLSNPKDSALNPAVVDQVAPSKTAMQISAPMRIACYCRHQNEKDGFQVIFTLKDHTGQVVAQAVSDSILITDDHKTHPMSAAASTVVFDGSQFPQSAFGSQSMVDLHSHMPNLPMSKSTGNLTGMGFGSSNGFHQSGSSIHHIPQYGSQTTSGSMTPRNLSRPASPTGLGQAGPAKKRKSSSTHRKLPSGLAMTKVDTSQPPSSASTSALTSGPFSPTSAVGFNQDGSFSALSAGSRKSFHNTGATPNESFGYRGGLNRTSSLDQSNFNAFYSAPNSAHQSRAGSPVLQGPNLAAFQRQQSRPNPFALQSNPTSNPSQSSMDSTPHPEPRPPPIINKVVPSDGPTAGGIEVSIYGQNFAPGMEVMFGDRSATATTYWGEKALCCVLPPSASIGPVHVSIAGHYNHPHHHGATAHHLHGNTPGSRLSTPHLSSPGTTFRYSPDTTDMRMMEMALRFYSLKMTGTEDNWQSTAQDAANRWMSAAASGVGDGGQPPPGQALAAGPGPGGPGGPGAQGQGQQGQGMPGAFPS